MLVACWDIFVDSPIVMLHSFWDKKYHKVPDLKAIDIYNSFETMSAD